MILEVESIFWYIVFSNMAQPLEKVRLGIIGCGYWGKHYVRIANTLKRSECKIICDVSKIALNKIKKTYPSIKTTTSIDELCSSSEVDAIVVVVPACKHFQIAKKCLLAGLFIFVYKLPLKYRSNI